MRDDGMHAYPIGGRSHEGGGRKTERKKKGEFMTLNKDLLEILACPKCVREPGCTGELEYREAANQLVCHHCKLIYRIEDDIPIMLIDEAIPLDKG
jgi:uncharacterized protein